MSEINISLFKPSRNGKPGLKPHPTDFYSEMAKIKDGTHYPVIKKLREITNELEKKTYKSAKLEGFTISAVVSDKREIKNCKPSGLLAIDLDPKGNPTVTDWGAVRDMLFEMPEVVAAFLSASGRGVAFVVKIDPKKFKDVFYSIKDELADNFELAIDPGCHDISRLRFTSCDPDLRMRDNFDAIPIKEPSSLYLQQKAAKEKSVIEYTGDITNADCDRAFSYAEKSAQQKIGNFGDGHKHAYLVSLAGFCNVIGMSQQYLESEVAKRYHPLTDISLERLLKPIQNVYGAYRHKHDTFKQTVQNRRKTNQIVGEVVNNYVRKGEKVTPEILDTIAQKLEANIEDVQSVVERVEHEYSEEFNVEAKKENASFKTFWYVDDDAKVNISKMAFRDFLGQKGIYRYKVEKDWILIRIVNNVVEEIQKDDLKQLVFGHIEAMKEYEVWEVLANRVHSVFADDYLEILPSKEIDFYRDDKHIIRLFFNNAIAEIKKDSINLINWNEFKGYIWKKNILNRDISIIPRVKNSSQFEMFLRNVSNNDEKRFLSLCSAIGYLIHLHKSKIELPAVILNDEVISDDPAGGTGKGLIMDAISRYRNVENIDGKLFDFGDKFRYQNVTIDTQVVFFDDVLKSFSFEKLFSTLTTSFEVEQKGGLKFKLAFSNSPKIAISTNNAINGTSDSFVRRKFDVEISAYYSPKHTPGKEFGKQLFDDFDATEWLNCDNFIFEVCALYLADGLVKQELVNQPIKQLYSSTDRDFVEFMDEEYSLFFASPYKIDQVEAYHNYQKLYPSKLGAKMFYKFMERYFKHHDIEVIRRKSNGVRYFYIGGLC